MVKSYGRGPAKRWLTAQAKKMGLKIVFRRGTNWWFTKDDPCNVVCLRFGRFTLRRLLVQGAAT